MHSPVLSLAGSLAGVRLIVHDLPKNGSRPVRLQTLTVSGDRIYPKPKREVDISGQLQETHRQDPLTSLQKLPSLHKSLNKNEPTLSNKANGCRLPHV